MNPTLPPKETWVRRQVSTVVLLDSDIYTVNLGIFVAGTVNVIRYKVVIFHIILLLYGTLVDWYT